jgi:hypothetical protein
MLAQGHVYADIHGENVETISNEMELTMWDEGLGRSQAYSSVVIETDMRRAINAMTDERLDGGTTASAPP